jgi:hypothetical protein
MLIWERIGLNYLLFLGRIFLLFVVVFFQNKKKSERNLKNCLEGKAVYFQHKAHCKIKFQTNKNYNL